MKIKFTEEKITGIMGLTLIQHLEHGPLHERPPGGFQIWADEMGIRFKGDSIHFTDGEMLEVMAKAVGRAWEFHETHRKKITNVRGH